MGVIRVLVVEDSLTVRKRLCELLATDPEIEVVGEAGDGKQAIELARTLLPDVVTMDMMLPVMSGLAATEYIMAYCPRPILIVSASTNRGELFKTYEALAAGAVDVLEKPRGDADDAAWARRLIATLKLVARIRVITHPRAKLEGVTTSWSQPFEPRPVAPAGAIDREVVVIGASTGGPGALVKLLRGLSPNFSLPVIVVLHINEPFGSAFADWLDGQTDRGVAFARDGEALASAAGRVLIAPAGSHLAIDRTQRVRLTDGPERHSCRPSVDVLFESAAATLGARVAACLLTGMGRDGAAGMLAVRRAGGLTLAQDEASSTIYGMPREAVLLGAVERSLPISEFGPTLSALGRPRRDKRS
jgi:two-component system chemotaxis response regulator CheB